MSEKQTSNSNSNTSFLSTYAVITASNLLKHYNIQLQRTEIESAVHSLTGFYHQVIEIPLKNIFNTHIITRTQDYQNYIQKLFVDYSLSEFLPTEEGMPGWSTELTLKEEQQTLITLGETLNQKEREHRNVIAKSQNSLKQLAATWNNMLSVEANSMIKFLNSQHEKPIDLVDMIQAINYLLNVDVKTEAERKEVWEKVEEILHQPINAAEREQLKNSVASLQHFVTNTRQHLLEYLEEISLQSAPLKEIKTEFYNLMRRVHQAIKSLPGPFYEQLQTQATEHRETLFLDRS